MASLVDTNVLVYRFDSRFPDNGSPLIRSAPVSATVAGFDAHMWAFAERYGLTGLVSEDFADGRMYGTVQAVNPFG